MDHNSAAGSVVAYNGQCGDYAEGATNFGHGVVGYPKSSGEPFYLPLLNYDDEIGSTSENLYLFYDGHRGYDFARPEGDEIIAAASGQLFLAIEQGQSSGDGSSFWRNKDLYPLIEGVDYSWEQYHTFYIVHENGYSTWYLHARETNPLHPDIVEELKQNGCAKVSRGQVIGYVGHMGVTANHLHFGVRRHGVLIPGNTTVSSELVDPYGNSDTDFTEVLWELLPTIK